MKYTYAYKTPDGVRHEAEIEAASREDAFAVLRGMGIRAIKVVAADGSKANGEMRVVGVRKRMVALIVALAVAVSAVLALTLARHATAPAEGQNKAVARHEVRPLPRMEIRGDRSRIEGAPMELFESPLEYHLSRFAEPGRRADGGVEIKVPTDKAAAVEILKRPIYAAEGEFTEYEELKRITQCMKKEMLDFLLAGGTVEEYCAELVKRQDVECTYREKAERKLSEMLSDAVTPESAAYDFWLKANARLQSMGIYPIALPPILRAYQSQVDLDE